MYKRENFVFESGERYATLVDDDGVPHFWVTLFVTTQLRPSHTQNSLLSILRDILHLHLWEEMNERNLVKEFGNGQFLSDTDAQSIRDHCAWQTRTLRRWHEQSTRRQVKRLSRSTLLRPDNQPVSKAHQANRIVNIAKYLRFVARSLLRQRANFIDLAKEVEKMYAKLMKQKPKVGHRHALTEPSTKAPAPELFDEFMRTVREDSPDNPYRDTGVRLRNALMFEVLYETGIRAGELLSLMCEDITQGLKGPVVCVARRHDDQKDPRAHQPVAKTLERDIPISYELYQRLRRYMFEVRGLIPKSYLHGYLFVTHQTGPYQGRPVSESTFRNRILKTAVDAKGDLFQEITRHGFRHNFNYRLSKRIDAHNQRSKTDPNLRFISQKEEIQVRKDYNGWASDASAEVYNLRHLKEVADQLMREDADFQLKKSGRNSKEN